MTDITHDNVFTNNDMVPRLRRILDEGPALPERATDHETPPHVPAKEKTGSELIAEKAIAPIRQTGQHLLDQFPLLHERLNQAEQVVIKVMADSEAIIHAEVGALNVVAKIIQDIEQQINEVMEPLAALRNGAGRE